MIFTCVSFNVLVIFCVGLTEGISLSYRAYANVSEGDKDMQFLLYTRKNPVVPEEFVLSDLDNLTNFDVNRPVKVLVHGWSNYYNSSFNILVKNAYLIQYDANVISVNWDWLSGSWYWWARGNVVNAAKVVALMIDGLITQLGVSPDRIHIVGHSLGAHVAGITGFLVKNGPIGRITGLDPAGPLFSSNEKMKISAKSAKFVDIIHTAGLFTGYYPNLGHVDFYPNGGYPVQPGCGVDFTTLRSHRRAYWLFAESITVPNGFMAIPCQSWNQFKNSSCPFVNITKMGEHVSHSARGTYFLRTNDRSPFSLMDKSVFYNH
ncbi:pancreatic lipase-related protein 2-like [Cimex lectularius]|uniref:Lipase domain-containing protein n=1 Tax=Cimex lectularius TaxID=79782 RepID=A0A8I6RSX1_CIMLE|nr:pancreatic lipase-related protein 2-like [Cimex lectularius]XP_014247545.1 pancreatic lipase-related protein 2-like [Cimex lectularius]